MNVIYIWFALKQKMYATAVKRAYIFKSYNPKSWNYIPYWARNLIRMIFSCSQVKF
jgi:hypothetical protein